MQRDDTTPRLDLRVLALELIERGARPHRGGAAVRFAAWRLGHPIETFDQLAAWLATARPFTLSPAMVDAIGPIVISGLVARGPDDPDALVASDCDATL